MELEPLTLKEIASAVAGRLVSGSPEAKAQGVSTDSRNVRPGEIFLALSGPRYDGHAFVPEALEKGACGAVVKEGQMSLKGLGPGKGIILVADTLRALGDLAAYVRRKHSVPLVAITGSNGKTTTKEMTAAILGLSRRVLKSQKNMNNLVGLPLTLLSLDETYEAAVVELGTNHPGEIGRLSLIAQPEVAVVTNIGPVHLEGLGSVAGVAEEKKEILKGLKAPGTLIFNAEDELSIKTFRNCGRKYLTFGLSSPKANFRAISFKRNEKGQLRARLDLAGEEISITLPGPGLHNLENAVAAAAAARCLNATEDEIVAALEGFSPLERRGEIKQLACGVTLIDDSYNANPRAMEQALKTLMKMPAQGRKLALLGDMRELGIYADEAHLKLGEMAASSAIDYLLFLGDYGEVVAKGALKGGLKASALILCKDQDGACEALGELLKGGDLLLVKASRTTGLDQVVDGLILRLGGLRDKG